MIDKVSGSTSGTLILKQTSTGGIGGFSKNTKSGAGGKATSSLAAVNSRGGTIDATSESIGGAGGNASNGNAEKGGDANSALTISGSSSLTGSVIAKGGRGGDVVAGNAGNGGTAAVSPITATSTSGANISLTASVTGGNGGNVDQFNNKAGNGGDGASVSLVNSVDANSTGAISLRQDAFAGSGGSACDGVVGQGGSANNVLSIDKNATSLSVEARTFSGNSGSKIAATGRGRDGQDATVSFSVTNRGGSSFVHSTGRAGGSGGDGGADAGDGGDIVNTISAITFGDGHSATAFSEDIFGGGSGITRGNSGSRSGDAGNAKSTTSAIVHGNSAASATDFTRGGGSGLDNGAGTVGRSGNAESNAIATGLSSYQTIRSYAKAQGGSTTPGGRGGDAIARASSTGLGTANAEAWALGGGNYDNGKYGSALARAEASGADAQTNAMAFSGGSKFGSIQISAGTMGAGASAAEARAVYAQAAPDRSAAQGLQAASFFTAMPLSSDVRKAATGSLSTSKLVTEGATSLVLGTISMVTSEIESSQRVFAKADFSIDQNLGSTATPIKLALFNPQVTGSGFDKLTVLISISTRLVQSLTFTDIASAYAYFDDHVFDLGKFVPGSSKETFSFIFGIESNDSNSGFAFDYMVVAVPEPGTIALIILAGCVALAFGPFRRTGSRWKFRY